MTWPSKILKIFACGAKNGRNLVNWSFKILKIFACGADKEEVCGISEYCIKQVVQIGLRILQNFQNFRLRRRKGMIFGLRILENFQNYRLRRTLKESLVYWVYLLFTLNLPIVISTYIPRYHFQRISPDPSMSHTCKIPCKVRKRLSCRIGRR